jgi:hypothetical protein
MFRSKLRPSLHIGFLLAVSAALCAERADLAQSVPSLANVCTDSSTLHDATRARQQPYLFAWMMFLVVNCPANSGADAPRTWETWKPVQEVYVPKGQSPAPWGAPLGPRILLDRQEIDGFTLLDVKGQPVLNEIRMNQGAFDYIMQRKLYSQAGQLAFFNGSEQPIAFPSESIEIKAAWLILDPLDPRTKTYYTIHASYVDPMTGQSHAVLAGLAGFHIASKLLPNWFWTTFEHTGNQQMTKAPDRTPDPLDVRAINDAVHAQLPQNSIWRFYNMRGVQTEYAEPNQQPTLLANTLLETRFQKSSSCITCHNLSTRGSAKEGRLGLWDRNYQGHVGQVGAASNRYFDAFGKPVCYDARGDAFTNCSTADAKIVYKTMDFVWSLREAQ